jgi:hypothetical protein
VTVFVSVPHVQRLPFGVVPSVFVHCVALPTQRAATVFVVTRLSHQLSPWQTGVASPLVAHLQIFVFLVDPSWFAHAEGAVVVVEVEITSSGPGSIFFQMWRTAPSGSRVEVDVVDVVVVVVHRLVASDSPVLQ